MSIKRPLPPRPLPGWLVLAGSAFVAFHLFAIGILVLSAQSGPWVTPFGVPSPAVGPMFAARINNVTYPYYLQPLQMTHNYHFLGNRPEATGISFEIRLKDDKGRLVDTYRFPSPKDNAWLRQRHLLMAAHLGDDQLVQAPNTELVPAPGQKMPTEKIWEQTGPTSGTLREVQTHLIPKNQPVYKPRDWSLILVRSYARHLCREHGAASAEIVRYSRQPVMPGLMMIPEDRVPPNTWDTLASTFEEVRYEDRR
jgi:hypothetical protein